jgi:hypothetical protein
VLLIGAASGVLSHGGSIFGGNYAMKRLGKLTVFLSGIASGASAPGGSIFGGNYAMKRSGKLIVFLNGAVTGALHLVEAFSAGTTPGNHQVS